MMFQNVEIEPLIFLAASNVIPRTGHFPSSFVLLFLFSHEL